MSAANFAPFEAPPDEKRQSAPLASSSSAATAPPRAPPTVPRTTLADEEDEDDLDPRYATESYQSSYPASASAPFLGSASAGQPSRPYSGGGGAGSYRDGFPHGATPTWAASAPAQQQYNLRPDHSSYSTSQGWSLSNLCFAAWALPPFSSVLMLIFETENDLARFHAYQSGICGIAIVLFLWILRSLFGWKTLSIIVGMAGLGWSWVCGSTAANSAPTLTRAPYLPHVGPLADQWVGEE
ncbi:hypothetical protein FA10DRAFT_266181 [Acaromyces ingoldii]|uniref:Uncharacterized protein n=1 Tax=Acaromyces ingoldii TaxID=215250 RepID=A0A316YWI9_9BASI|nr:hypothetical protein FA10DRAFT_266181 [Acaromyces ingoldii]PWN92413.1 hypothetical protein FA10DRAFT_266181 [Acaromyces ingoldii]